MSAQPNSALPATDRKTYRVVQWATGRIGTSSLRELITGAQFELVGVYVHSAAKEGCDAGELCGLPPTGVKATRDIQKIIALQPDCVVSNMEGVNLDDVCRFLEAGINVATSRVDFLEPEQMDPEVRRRVEEACRKGGASIHSSGSSPGFSSEALPFLLTSMSRRMESMTIDEYANIPLSCPDIQCTQGMGFGRQAGGEFDAGLLHHISHGFRQSVNLVAKTLGLKLDDIQVFGETANTTERVLLPQGTPLEKGTVGAQRITIAGMRNGKPLIKFRINWYCTKKIDQPWDLRDNGWRGVVEGDTPIDVNIGFPPMAPDKLSAAMAGLTAYRVVNAVPFLCDAKPGICTTADLPTIVPRMA